MKLSLSPVVLATIVLMLGTDLSLAVDTKTDEAAAASSKPSKADKQKEIAARRKAVAKVKVVNIKAGTTQMLTGVLRIVHMDYDGSLATLQLADVTDNFGVELNKMLGK